MHSIYGELSEMYYLEGLDKLCGLESNDVWNSGINYIENIEKISGILISYHFGTMDWPSRYDDGIAFWVVSNEYDYTQFDSFLGPIVETPDVMHSKLGLLALIGQVGQPANIRIRNPYHPIYRGRIFNQFPYFDLADKFHILIGAFGVDISKSDNWIGYRYIYETTQ